MRKIAEIILGIILVVIGFIGGFIPILQGWMIAIPGLLLLSKHFSPIQRIVNKFKNKIRNIN